MEIYKTITNYENYEVSNLGNIRNIKTNKLLNPFLKHGYYHVDLYNNGMSKHFRLHRLVALHFLENKENKPCIDHINNNRLDNNIENLRFSTVQENNWNTGLLPKNKTGIKGVSFDKKKNKWRVQISINRKKIHVGYYTNIDDAKQARINIANKLFGEFTNKCEKIN